ncbi:RNA polymerase sigma factor [Fontivita pretiosa]|uniref:RNA polymerase sigma factor n=1 Tax=Fontivita pretiosa TaxID=2989684 RepID=UPI003D16F85D
MREEGSPRELVQRVRQRRDRSAFAELARRYQRTALAIAYGIVGDAEAAGDITQEALLRVWQRLGDLDDPDRFAGWFASIVRNLAHDHLRRRPRERRQTELPDAVTHSGHDWPVADGDGRLVVDPLAQIDRDETRSAINQALAELDELTRTAVALRYYQNLSSRQIGQLLDLSPAAVDMRLSRGRAELRRRLARLVATRPAPTAPQTGPSGGDADATKNV